MIVRLADRTLRTVFYSQVIQSEALPLQEDIFVPEHKALRVDITIHAGEGWVYPEIDYGG